jgi:carboxypeptidase C (cathepsin A)
MTKHVRPWSYEEEQNRYVNVGETLRRAMNKNRHLKLMVCSGYYDLATPFFGSDYTVAHLGLEPELRTNIRVRYYEAGHMMYIHGPSRRRLKKDVSDFYQAVLARE